MGLPLTVYPGTYTPGAETALHAAVDVINEAWAQANTKLAAFEAKVDAITNEETGWLKTTAAPHVTGIGTATAPTVVEPGVSIPETIDTSTILATFEGQYTALRTVMAGDLAKIFDTYFPQDAVDFAAAETWLKNALANNSGLPSAVKDQMLTDERDAIVAETTRASDALTQRFAAMRFPLPSGALASAQLQIQQKAQDSVAASARKITVASVEQLRWATEKLFGLREMAMGNAIDYIKTLVAGPATAAQVTGIGYDAQTKLISSASQFYGVRADVAKLKSSVEQFNVTTAFDVSVKNQAADLTLIEDRLKALLMECQAFAQMATAMFNNLHASAGTSYGVNGT